MTDSTPLRFPAGLYGITPDWDDTPRLLRAVRAAHDGGLKVLQFRRKQGSQEALHQQLTQLSELCASLELPLLINDHWSWALQFPVQGAHLGKDDGDLIQARHALGQHALLGRSCYNSLELARQALAEGADYIAFGAVFPSSVKSTQSPMPASLWSILRERPPRRRGGHRRHHPRQRPGAAGGRGGQPGRHQQPVRGRRRARHGAALHRSFPSPGPVSPRALTGPPATNQPFLPSGFLPHVP